MNPSNLFSSLSRILKLGRPHKSTILLGIFATLVTTAITLVIPLGLRELLDAVFENHNRELLNTITWVMVVLFLVQAVVGFFGRYLLDRTGERIVTDLRIRLYEHLHRLDLKYFTNQRLGDITSRLTNDVSSIRNTITETSVELITQTLNLLGSITLMVILNWRLSLLIFAVVPLVSLASRFYGQKIRALSRTVQDRLADTTAMAEEILSAIREVKSNARELWETQRYNAASEELFETARRRVFVSSVFWTSMGFIFFSIIVLVFWFGGREVLEGRLSAGDLVAFIFYAFGIARSVGGMSRIYTSVNTAVGASGRIFEMLDTIPEINDLPNARSIDRIEGKIDFENVCFAYESTRVLHRLNLTIEAGKTLALVGPSGAGKTTLVNLIPRFFDPTDGAISVDGINLKALTQRSLRSQIALVPQDIHLFGSSIAENIRYGFEDADDEQIIEAARKANALEFIERLPEGINTMVGERGVKLSGGQRQRVAIARAILKNPPILLLDEATSSLDSQSEMLVQQALELVMKNRTTVVIAHRLSTVRTADRILVLDQGRVVQDGTHASLMEQGGLYRHLYDLQFNDEKSESLL